jgi:hypothetical protein
LKGFFTGIFYFLLRQLFYIHFSLKEKFFHRNILFFVETAILFYIHFSLTEKMTEVSEEEAEAFDSLVYLVLSDLCMVEYFPSSYIAQHVVQESKQLCDFNSNVDHITRQLDFESSEELRNFVCCCLCIGHSLEDIVSFFTTSRRPDATKMQLFYQFKNLYDNIEDVESLEAHNFKEFYDNYTEYLTKRKDWESSRPKI